MLVSSSLSINGSFSNSIKKFKLLSKVFKNRFQKRKSEKNKSELLFPYQCSLHCQRTHLFLVNFHWASEIFMHGRHSTNQWLIVSYCLLEWTNVVFLRRKLYFYCKLLWVEKRIEKIRIEWPQYPQKACWDRPQPVGIDHSHFRILIR